MLLKLQNISKVFGEAKVLNAISLDVSEGVILGLVGENGAGKSTLMNIMSGVLSPSEGSMHLKGQTYQPANPQEALKAGIAMIHQELNLFANLSIEDNLHLLNFPAKTFGLSWIKRKQTRQQAQSLLSRVGLELDTGRLVEDLTPAQKQLLEIAKALSSSPHIIIFDEPTTSLTSYEVTILFKLIKELKAAGLAIIYISHNLEDVMQLADQIAVLRDGKLVGHHTKQQNYQLPMIIHQMVGRELAQFFPDKQASVTNEKLLEVKKLGAEGLLRDISFSINKQEILGFYGLVGAGRSEMARCIYGLDPLDKGEIYWKGHRINHPLPDLWIQHQVAFLTEDRRDEGLLLSENLEKNISLAALPHHTSPYFQLVDSQKIHESSKKMAEATRIKFQDMKSQSVGTLSGGNQQKVVLSKWLLIQPELMIMEEPTKGIDIGAKHEIYKLMLDLVDKGASILLISSEIEELLGLCDRIIVMKSGHLSAQYKRSQFKRSDILEAALHQK
jgi:ABC-type sugar transport system ATPase subunit